MNFSEFAHKKVAGIPVLYLAGAAVIVLAIVAWRMKPSADFTDDPDQTQGAPEDGSTLEPQEGDDPYGSLATNGTVTVVQQPTAPVTPDIMDTNEEWIKAGAEWAVTAAAQAKGVHTTGAAAVAALNQWLQGEDLNYDQTQIVEAVIAEKGQPPEGVGATGKITNDAPAQRQFNNFPGTHTVKGVNDNTFTKIAVLYYNSNSGDTINLLAGNNPTLNSRANLAPGTVVKVPGMRPPRYITATNSMRNAPDIAKKNAITVATLWAFNPGMVFPVKVGTKVRIS